MSKSDAANAKPTIVKLKNKQSEKCVILNSGSLTCKQSFLMITEFQFQALHFMTVC